MRTITKRRKGVAARRQVESDTTTSATAQTPAPHSIAHPTHLRWRVLDEGTTPPTAHIVDITRIANGSSDPLHGFSSRPALIEEVAPALRYLTDRKSASTATALTKALRALLRWLDWYDKKLQCKVTSCLSLDEDAPHLLIEWLRTQKARPADASMNTVYVGIRRIIEETLKLNESESTWPVSPFTDQQTESETLSPDTVRHILHCAKCDARHVKARFQEGRELVAKGHDPRRAFGGRPRDWKRPECRAYYVRKIIDLKHVALSELRNHGHSSFVHACQQPGNEGAKVFVMDHSKPERRRGIRAHMRWFMPHPDDLLPFLVIVAIRTGWNLTTILAMDRTDWRSVYAARVDDSGRPTHAIVHSKKRRGSSLNTVTGASSPGKLQVLVTPMSPEWHVYRVIHYVIRITLPIRREIDRRLDQLGRIDAHSTHSSSATDEMRSLLAMRNKVWLYFNESERGIGCLSTEVALPRSWRQFAQRYDLAERDEVPLGRMFRQFRNATISFAYRSTGQNLFLAQLAANHSHLATTEAYLRKKDIQEGLQDQFQKALDIAFIDIGTGRFSARDIRRRLLLSGLTAEQSRNAMSPQFETIWGNRCADPTRPPQHIDPGHRPGDLCISQSCLDECPFARWFDDSLPTVARRVIETRKSLMSLGAEAVTSSSWLSRLARLESLLERWPAARVTRALEEADAERPPSSLRISGEHQGVPDV